MILASDKNDFFLTIKKAPKPLEAIQLEIKKRVFVE